MITKNKKAAAAATTATLKKLQIYSETSFATLGKAAARCKISDISASVALMMALTAAGVMEWHLTIALMILIPAAGMAIASNRFTECSTYAEQSRPDSCPSRVVGMSGMASPAPSTARPMNLSTGRTSRGDKTW